MKLVLSSEGAECSLACVAMVAQFHGHDVDLGGLRARFGLSMAGANLRTLLQMLSGLGLPGRALRIEPPALQRIQLPAILHWDFNHFVVLARILGNRYLIHDPARGRLIVDSAELSRRFTGVAIEVGKSADFHPESERRRLSLSGLWSRLDGAPESIGFLVTLTLALQVTIFATPVLLQLTVDGIAARGDLSAIPALAFGFAGLLAVRYSIELLRGWMVQELGTYTSFQLSHNIVAHLLRLPPSFFEKRHVGDIFSRLYSAKYIEDLLTRGTVSTIVDGLCATFSVAILFAYSPLLAVVTVASCVAGMVISIYQFPWLRIRAAEQLSASALEQTHVLETARAAATLRILGKEAQRSAEWRNLYARLTNATLRQSRLEVVGNCGRQALAGASTSLIIFLGARMILSGGGMSIGMLLAFLAFRQTFTDRITALLDQLTHMRLLAVHLERLSDVIFADADPMPAMGGVTPAESTARVELRGVSFQYGFGDRWVVDGLDLSISDGEFVAVVGPSGSGKTTLLKLMLGLQRPSRGEVLLDGEHATPLRWQAWRQKVGVVFQDDHLLAGTIAENIAFFDPNMDMERVISAARSAALLDELGHQSGGLLRRISDDGCGLSGGQRQRLLLARALYRSPAILLLDEGTANLDPAAEEAIADRIAALPITRLVIAHRPALVRRADRILVLRGGQLHDVKSTSGVAELAPTAAT